jgi:acyl-CoA reductase-like NAD-dependent aldehyde dehydrogenase
MTDNVLEVCNPFDQKPIGSVPLTSWDEADRMLETASRLYKNRKAWLPAYKRIEILKKTATLMQERFDALAFQIANEGGKPLIDARVEVARAIDGVGLCIKGLDHMAGHEIPMDLTAAGAGRAGFTFREPIGPVIAVSAFNHPLNLIVHQVGPAIAVGCPVIVKPAGTTPLSAKAFVDMLHEAGLPEDWCRFAACKSAVAEKLVTDPRTAFFTFIGSGKIGWMLRNKIAPGTRCALEHGGVAPVIIEESADIDAMIPPLLKGGFYHAGQVCVSVQKVFAPKALAEDIAKRLADGASKLKVGNATHETTEVGPLIQPAEVDRVAEWVQEAVNSGAKALCGAKKLGDTTYAPTVLLNPPANAKVSTEEIFGPVVCVYAYDNIDQAILQANALPFAFQAACFTNRLDIAMKCVREMDAATVIVNDHTAFRVDWMPFAGHRHSGYGTGGIAYTMHDMTHEKLMVLNNFSPKCQ